jgi:hypothetical protein
MHDVGLLNLEHRSQPGLDGGYKKVVIWLKGKYWRAPNAKPIIVFDFQPSGLARGSHPTRKNAYRMTACLELVRLTLRDDFGTAHYMGRKEIADNKNTEGCRALWLMLVQHVRGPAPWRTFG